MRAKLLFFFLLQRGLRSIIFGCCSIPLIKRYKILKCFADKLQSGKFVAQLKQLPDTMKTSMQNMAYSMIQDGSLYDLRKIKAMDEILGTELTMMI